MRTTIDAAGRVVVPKAVRERLGLGPGSALELVERDGVLEIAPAPVEVLVEERGCGPVLVTAEDVAPLTDDDVRRLVEAGRR